MYQIIYPVAMDNRKKIECLTYTHTKLQTHANGILIETKINQCYNKNAI